MTLYLLNSIITETTENGTTLQVRMGNKHRSDQVLTSQQFSRDSLNHFIWSEGAWNIVNKPSLHSKTVIAHGAR